MSIKSSKSPIGKAAGPIQGLPHNNSDNNNKINETKPNKKISCIKKFSQFLHVLTMGSVIP